MRRRASLPLSLQGLWYNARALGINSVVRQGLRFLSVADDRDDVCDQFAQPWAANCSRAVSCFCAHWTCQTFLFWLENWQPVPSDGIARKWLTTDYCHHRDCKRLSSRVRRQLYGAKPNAGLNKREHLIVLCQRLPRSSNFKAHQHKLG